MVTYDSCIYSRNDYRNYLSHHGVMGMHWGVRRYQPYGKGGYIRKDSPEQISRKKKVVGDLSRELNEQWDYGALINGKRVTDTSNVNWEKDYRTIPVKTLEKEKIGTCWDFVNYQHYKLQKAGIKNDSYLMTMDLSTKDNPNRIITHAFTTFELDGKTYWLESAMWPKRGVHEIKDFKQAARSCAKNYTNNKVAYDVYKYDPDGMDKGLTDKEFFERATRNNVLKVKGRKDAT